jgi:hypothetical protein
MLRQGINMAIVAFVYVAPMKRIYVEIHVQIFLYGHAVAWFEALCYKPEDRGFDSR